MSTDKPHERKTCGAKNRQGNPCQRLAMANGRCDMHGGKTPTGLALPQTKTGRYSKSIPARLADRYHEAESDNELLALQSDISLLDSRIHDVLAATSNQESGELWENLKTAKRNYLRAKDDDAKDALADMLYLIDEGHSEGQNWRELRQMLQERAKLVEGERKRLESMQQMITAEQATLFAVALLGIIKKHVSDRNVLSAIQADVASLLSKPN